MSPSCALLTKPSIQRVSRSRFALVISELLLGGQRGGWGFPDRPCRAERRAFFLVRVRQDRSRRDLPRTPSISMWTSCIVRLYLTFHASSSLTCKSFFFFLYFFNGDSGWARASRETRSLEQARWRTAVTNCIVKPSHCRSCVCSCREFLRPSTHNLKKKLEADLPSDVCFSPK